MTTHDGITKGWTRDEMAARAAKELRDGFYVTSISAGTWLATSVGMPIPRLT